MTHYNSVASKFLFLCDGILISLCSISFIYLKENSKLIPLFIIVLIGCNLLPLFLARDLPSRRIRLCEHGVNCLLLFLISLTVSIAFHIVMLFKVFPDDKHSFFMSILLSFAVEFIIFWNGMISIYVSSLQLGIKWRVIGALLGFVPIANLIALITIMRIVSSEVSFEMDKHLCNMQRVDEQLCATKYPRLLVHGVFFRDTHYFNYWGRIPKELETNGASIYYGEHQSANSIAGSAAELAARIREIVAESGCEKVNIIAHSKGGLDCRYALRNLGIAPYVASLTTVNTPHRGCLFADYLLEKIPEGAQNYIADTYNAAMKKLGDENPDFIAAVNDLTSTHCTPLDSEMPIPEGIFCQSVGSKLNGASSGQFPLNFSYMIAKCFDGDNDGLVGEHSFSFGENFTYLTVEGKRGISHGDVIDLNRENIPEFDVREFYVQLVSDLKQRGL